MSEKERERERESVRARACHVGKRARAYLPDFWTEIRPEHRLVGVASPGPGHVLACEPPADHGVVVMLLAPPAEHHVVEAGDVAGHPQVGPGLELGVDQDTALDRIDLEPCLPPPMLYFIGGGGEIRCTVEGEMA